MKHGKMPGQFLSIVKKLLIGSELILLIGVIAYALLFALMLFI